MAKRQYIADSASLPPLSLRPGGRNEDPVTFVSSAAGPAHDASPAPAACVVACGAMYVGESADPPRRLPAHGARAAKPDLSASFPTTPTSIA